MSAVAADSGIGVWIGGHPPGPQGHRRAPPFSRFFLLDRHHRSVPRRATRTRLVGVPAAAALEPGVHWLGTTGQGQDVLAQLVVRARGTSLAIGISASASSSSWSARP